MVIGIKQSRQWQRLPLLILVFILIIAGCLNGQPDETAEDRQVSLQQTPDQPASAAVEPPDTAENNNEAEDPNLVPYKSRRSLIGHILMLPARIWRLPWIPVGATVVWAEHNKIPQKLIGLFYLNDERTAAIFPLASVGGSTLLSGGAMFFNNDLFGTGSAVSTQALFSNDENYSAELKFADKQLFGSNFFFDIGGSYFKDSDENLFISDSVCQCRLDNSSIGANRSLESDERSYAIEELNAIANLGYAITPALGLGFVSSLRRIDIAEGDADDPDDKPLPLTIPGIGETSLFSIGGALTFNFSNGWPRTLSGTLLRLRYTYNKELDGKQFEFNRYTAELQQFLPIPFMAKNRRLGLRSVFEKIDRLGDGQIPFYELSTLGSAETIRGYEENRFRGRGALFFNLEYRYPIWKSWDAVIFMDQGQVFDDISELRADAFQASYGAGIRFMTLSSFLLRMEIGISDEKARFLFEISPNF